MNGIDVAPFGCVFTFLLYVQFVESILRLSSLPAVVLFYVCSCIYFPLFLFSFFLIRLGLLFPADPSLVWSLVVFVFVCFVYLFFAFPVEFAHDDYCTVSLCC